MTRNAGFVTAVALSIALSGAVSTADQGDKSKGTKPQRKPGAATVIVRVPLMPVKIGDAAPKFAAKDDQGKAWKSTDHVGKKVLVVYFYPADMTGGCTAQACAFRDDMKTLKDKGVEVVGVSGDSVGNHKIFKKEYELNYTLLADVKGEVAHALGVPVRKGGSIKRKVDGEDVTLTRGVTAPRWTFVFDQNGKLVHKNTEVNARKDSKEVLEVVEKLQKKD